MPQTKVKNCQELCLECDTGPFTRNYYFTGKLLVERDFKQEQAYYVDKFRHHDQQLHGWGVVCGLKVHQHETAACQSRFISIKPGTAIDCCGHEILVHDEECIDITQLPAIKALIAKKDTASHTLQVCISYRECPTEQIPVLYDDCGCNETQCAPNRILESYDIDVLVDTMRRVASPKTPSLRWHSTLNIAHPHDVVFSERTHSLYVLTADAPGAIYKVSPDNFAIVAARTLTAAEGTAQALAVSNDGARLYVALASGNLLVLNTADFSEAATAKIPGAGAGVKAHLAVSSDGAQLYVALTSGDLLALNTADFNKAAITKIPGAGAGLKIHLAVAPTPDNRLLSLVETTGTVHVWPSAITNNAAPAVTINLGSSSTRSAASRDATRTSSTSSNAPAAADQNAGAERFAIEAAAFASALPADAVPTAVALVESSTGKQLAITDQKNRLFLVAMSTPPALVGPGPATLGNPGVDVVSSPDGLWAYVLERDADGNSFVEAIDLGRLRQNLPLAPATPLPVGRNSLGLVLSQSGETLVAPYLDNAGIATHGGLAIIKVSEKDCCDLLWNSLDNCPSCDTANCVVLATIEKYEVGFSILDPPDPPAASAKDVDNQIARINNRTRRLLPSTTTIAEVVQCLCESKGGKAPKGDPGAPDLGLNPNLPKILDIGWVHKDNIGWDQFVSNLKYQTSEPLNKQVLRQILQSKNPPLLLIYFKQTKLTGIDRQTFRVSIEYPLVSLGIPGKPIAATSGKIRPSTVFTGIYNAQAVNVYGYPIEVARPLTTPHTKEMAESAWAFIPDQNFFTQAAPDLINKMFLGSTLDPALDLPCVHVCLKGDFIYAAAAFSDGVMLDADNVGGQVGQNVTRGGAILGGKNPSGDMLEGGDFESWFFLQPPQSVGPPLGRLTHLDSASADELAKVPGISEALAKKIVLERAKGRFRSIDDLAARLRLNEKTINSIRDHITLESEGRP